MWTWTCGGGPDGDGAAQSRTGGVLATDGFRANDLFNNEFPTAARFAEQQGVGVAAHCGGKHALPTSAGTNTGLGTVARPATSAQEKTLCVQTSPAPWSRKITGQLLFRRRMARALRAPPVPPASNNYLRLSKNGNGEIYIKVNNGKHKST